MTLERNTMPLEDVLDELFYGSEVLEPVVLKRLMTEYPEYQSDLADFVMHWARTARLDDSALLEGAPSTEQIARLQSAVLAQISSRRDAATDRTPVSAETALGQLKGATALSQASRRIGLGDLTGLLGKLLQGGIADVPQVIVERLATLLGQTPDELLTVLNSRTFSYSYKSPDKPMYAGRETWADAVNRLQIPEDEKRTLIAFSSED